MNKLDMESKNMVNDNIFKIGELFPEVLKENGEKKFIDFEALKQALSNELIDDKKEKYELVWPGKRESIINANTPTNKILRPIKEKSLNFDSTENIYIEGDNLEVLKILQESYLNKVKCIYIDPPYNTGNDFIYNDNFNRDVNSELLGSGQIDEEGNRLVTNSTSNGRFHSDWLSMMYARLKVARNLLTDDGVIFISIDDNEQSNLKKICDEIFGENNFITNIIWQKKFSPQNDATYFSQMHDFILCYAKKKKNNKADIGWDRNLLERETMPDGYKNPDNDPRGPWSSGDFTAEGPTPNCVYEIVSPTGKKWMPPEGKRWVYNYENFLKLYEEKRFWFGKDGNALPRIKRYWSEVQQGMVPNSIWLFDEVGHTQEGKQETNSLFGAAVFDYPKPIRLLNRILKLGTNDGDIVLDFFSGSASTAHALLKLNSEKEEKRKFIMVQVPEKTDEKSEAYKHGYKTICDLGEDRIRKAGEKIKAETNANIDYGFRVYKVDSSNMKDDFYKTPGELDQTQLKLFETNIKEDRSADDLLAGVILDLGLTLDYKVQEKIFNNNKVYFVNDNELVACFDETVDINIIDEISEVEPLMAVFRDDSFKTDSDKINLEERFKKLSPNTKISIL